MTTDNLLLEQAKEFLGEPSAFFCDCGGQPRWIDSGLYHFHEDCYPVADAFGEINRPSE